MRTGLQTQLYVVRSTPFDLHLNCNLLCLGKASCWLTCPPDISPLCHAHVPSLKKRISLPSLHGSHTVSIRQKQQKPRHQMVQHHFTPPTEHMYPRMPLKEESENKFTCTRAYHNNLNSTYVLVDVPIPPPSKQNKTGG